MLTITAHSLSSCAYHRHAFTIIACLLSSCAYHRRALTIAARLLSSWAYFHSVLTSAVRLLPSCAYHCRVLTIATWLLPPRAYHCRALTIVACFLLPCAYHHRALIIAARLLTPHAYFCHTLTFVTSLPLPSAYLCRTLNIVVRLLSQRAYFRRVLTLDLDPCLVESAPSELGEANDAASGAANEGLITVQGEELEVIEASEPHKTAVGVEGSGITGEEEPILIEQPGVIVPDNRDEDVGNEGPNASQEESPNGRPEQPRASAPDVVIEASVLEFSEVEARLGP
ncbi:hypothetical protein AMTR_s00027p00114230 [Amborella trichopoda]|uniref:Uncharacterized protein n=1 Tax=Amborella trichopoda TaxID=13333 RepID=W1PTX3_AMBTC|nr:hypothetical protein AMTR_s00027p00114230 [Amborella trichopoda]